MARFSTNVANSEDGYNLHAQNRTSIDLVFKEPSVENPLMANSTRTAIKSTQDYYRAQRQQDIMRRVLRSYSCSSSNQNNEVSSSIIGHSVRDRTPLASCTTQAALTPGLKRRKAVLPNRDRQRQTFKYEATASSRDQYRLYHSAAKNDLVELLVQKGIADTKSGGKLVENYLRKQSMGRKTVGCNTKALCIEKRETECYVPNYHGIDSATIFKQLTILKRGGYWEYLQNGIMQEEDNQSNEERPSHERWNSSLRKEDHKENVPRANHTNTRGWNDEQDLDEDEDYGEELQTYWNRTKPFIGSALADTQGNGICRERIGFRVLRITKDGWMCCPEGSLASSSSNHGAGSQNDSSFFTNGSEQQQQPLLLLQLPRKVSALGKQGMVVWGLDLMKRRDNGVLEPCNHCVDGSHDNTFDLARDSSREDFLFGSISL